MLRNKTLVGKIFLSTFCLFSSGGEGMEEAEARSDDTTETSSSSDEEMFSTNLEVTSDFNLIHCKVLTSTGREL